MTDFIDENEEEAIKRRKKGDSGEGDSDSFGRGKAGAGAGGGSRPAAVQKLSAEQMREVWANFKHYVGDELVTPVVEFFREVPARAAANCVVTWENAKKNNPKAFAIVNWVLRAGGDAVKAFDKGMGAGASGGGGMAFKVKPAPVKQGHTPGQNPNWIRPR